MREIVADSAEAAAEGWSRISGGAADRGHGSEARAPGAALVVDAGEEDPESGAAQGGGGTAGAPGVQRKLLRVVDAEALDALSSHLLSSQEWSEARKVTEQRDPSASHDWLWALNRAQGDCLPPEEYVAAVRLRVGAEFSEEPVICGLCSGCLDRRCAHALLCASAEATSGHYKVRDAVLELVSLADPAAETEVEGLIPSDPNRRPADILTGAALPDRLAALDVGVCAPDAVGAGTDCVESARRSKVAEYGDQLAELEARNIFYRPLTFSAFGRAHPEATAILTNVAKRAARRRGLPDHTLLLRRAQVKIGVQLARRAAKQVLACLPRLTAAEAGLLHGADPCGASPDDATRGGNDPAARAGNGLVTAGGGADLGA